MDNGAFMDRCKRIVADYYNEQHAAMRITEEDIFVAWVCKVLKNNKALLGTTIADGMYYEITYDGARDMFYLDVYKKQQNRSIQL